MHNNRFHRQVRKFSYLFILICLLAVNRGSVQAQSGCSVIYNGNNGWVIDMCATDPQIPTPMQVVVDGVSKGNAALVRIYHKSQSRPGTPQVAVIYASGFVRLKQNADPSPGIPFGTSFILGPAYYSGYSTYHHNPQLNRIEVDTTWLPNAPLRMRVQGTNHAFAVTYELTLPPPRDRQTRLHVTQTYTATSNVTVDPVRRSERQGFKLVQASSMFINEGGACDGYTDCHDSDAARFIGNNLLRRQVPFSSLAPPVFVFSSPLPLGSQWLDVLHQDDQSWQSQTPANISGNTPNVRITLDELPVDRTITPQGWITPTNDPNDDNVNLWLHDDGPASISWLAGQSGRIGYWLLAQDNPLEPWGDLGLRPGSTFLDFEGTYNCFFVKDVNQPTSGSVTPIAGYTVRALQLNYNLGSNNGNWAQVRCNFNPPLDLSAYDHLRFDWRGSPASANSLEVGLINPRTGGENIFARGYHHPTHHAWWGQMVVPFNFLHPWTAGTQFDPSRVSAIFFSVVKDPVADTGGAGSIAIDNLSADNLGSRQVPSSFQSVAFNQAAAHAAARWIGSQQQHTGLVKSWQEEGACIAHTYDQGLALIVFASRGMWTKASALVNALAATQNADGSWFKSRNCLTLEPVDNNKWEGDIAWAVYALSRYLALGGTHPQAAPVLQKGAAWLATRVSPVDGCLVIDHTEGTIDAWWAFQGAGASHVGNADKIMNCLLMHYWDDGMGRFKGGRNWQQPYLDNQTWGAAFLKAIGETEKARRALSYARDVLRLPAQGGQLFGFDGQAGPWSVWNEGTGQYIAVGGEGAVDLLQEILAQQRADGAMPGSPDEFNGGGVWTTRWHGIAPTAWLYNALCGEPFHHGGQPRCLPIPLPGAATLVSPFDAITDTTPTYTWNKVSAASWYYLWVSRVNTDGSLTTVHNKWYQSSVCGTSTCSVTPAGVSMSSGNYRWWVQTWNNGGYGPWSTAMNFSLLAIPLLGAATLVSPNGSVTDTTLTYTWDKVNASTWYYLWVSQVNSDGTLTTVHNKWYQSSVCGISTCSVTPAGVTLTGGNYRWWIQTWNNDGYGPWSNPMNFSLPVAGPPGAATLISPSGNISGTTPAYAWNKVNVATWYYLWVSRVNGDGTLTTIHSKWYDTSLVCSGATCTITPAGITLSGGSYRWWVRTWNAAGYRPWSSGMNFQLP